MVLKILIKSALSILLLLLIVNFQKLSAKHSPSQSDVTNDNDDANKQQQTKPIRIAIVGCGVGGSSAAYFLNELLSKQQDLKYEILIYEKSNKIGGRLHLATVDQKQYEAGGSIIHPRNRYVAQFMNKFGLKKRPVEASDSGRRLCIFNGDQFVFCESSWEIITLIKLITHYGFDLIRLQKYVSKVIDYFERIYDLQDDYNAYEQVSELLQAMDSTIYNLTKLSYYQLLTKDYRLSKDFIEQIVQSITLVNYGQTINIPALVGLISFAGAGSDLYSIQGGNQLLPIYLTHYSNASLLLNTQVLSINYLGDHQFLINSIQLDHQHNHNNNNNNETNLRKDIVDYIILATPMANENNLIKFKNLTKRNELINDIFDKYHLHRTIATIVKGNVLPKYKDLDILSSNIDRDNGGSFFTSLSRLQPVTQINSNNNNNNNADNDNKKTKEKDTQTKTNDKLKKVFKIFSNHRLDAHELYSLFDEIDDLQEYSWYAYPQYMSIKQPLPPFRLRSGVYYLNSIEWAASAIEMSLISAKNIALLICNDLHICQKFKNETIVNLIDQSTAKPDKFEL